MSLKEQLLQDLKAAMKEKDIIKKNTVQSIRTGVLQIEKDKQIELDDDGVLDVIARELKKRRDSLPDYEKSGREDLIEGLKGEISVLLSYLPKQLTEEEIAGIVEETIKELGASSMKDMGKVMAAITPKVKGRADNKIVSALVKEKLK
ncbi:MAG: GatB/YqeY domain-containing protein [Clostridiales bacterium]|nr:GatB/YqeY domain-containing protein [Clostridiales bacterium]